MNPLSVVDGKLQPEVMVLYQEDTELFNYMRSLLGEWDYYVSPVVKIRATAKIIVEAAGVAVESESECAAYVYGWAPENVEYIPGACTTIVFFEAPMLDILGLEEPVECTVRVEIEELGFAAERQVSICKTEIVGEE